MRTLEIRITGMTCAHCARHVEEALRALPGVRAEVRLEEGRARVATDGSIAPERLLEAITALGYGASFPDGEEPVTDGGGGMSMAIVGGGSAAFAAAIEAADRGARVTLIEGAEILGGTCVNVGCVPSKFLIRAAQIARLQENPPFEGLSRCRPDIDRTALLRQQQARVEALREAKYEAVLASRPEIRLLRGWARFADPNTLIVQRPDGSEATVTAGRILLATGSRPHVPDIPGLAGTPYWTSTEALAADRLPEHLVVLGGSVVALELAQAFLRLGSRVTLMARSRLLSRLDPALGEGLQQLLEEEGMRILTHTLPGNVRHDGRRFVLFLSDGGEVQCDRLLVATGRRPNTEGLGLERVGIEVDAQGAIRVDAHLRTSVPHVYAAGDCAALPQHVYVAAAAGTRAAIHMTGGDAALDLSVLPVVVFTDPQVASVGLDEAEAHRQGIEAASRTLALEHVPRAQVNLDPRGFVRLVAEREGGRLLGAQILAPEAGELVQAAALAIRARMTVDALGSELFPYLTHVEALKLCAQTFRKAVERLSCCAG